MRDRTNLFGHLLVVELGHALAANQLRQDALQQLTLSKLRHTRGTDDERIAVAHRWFQRFFIGNVSNENFLNKRKHERKHVHMSRVRRSLAQSAYFFGR